MKRAKREELSAMKALEDGDRELTRAGALRTKLMDEARSIGNKRCALRGVLVNERLHVLVVVALAFSLRFILATARLYDTDEAGAYSRAALSYLKGDWAVNSGHPMVVKLLFAGSIVLFGPEGKLGALLPGLYDSVGALRLVSVIAGTVTCLVIYYLVKEITEDHVIAIISSVLLAFDPISMGESSYGLLDPGMTLFYMASILFFYRYVKGRGGWNFYLSAVLFGLAVASKYFAFIAIVIFIGILLWKKRLRAEWKSMAAFLSIAIIVFVAVQPFLWSNPFANLSRSLEDHAAHLRAGQRVKIPGNPFLIRPTYNPAYPMIAAKPDFFYGTQGQDAPSPWYYILYIQAMYSTPFQILVYPLAGYKIGKSILRRRGNDLVMMGTLLVLTPILLFACLSVRLPQYTILSSTSSTVLGAVGFSKIDSKKGKCFLVLLLVLHVGWTFITLVTSGDHFSGWEFYQTPLTPYIADFLHWLWTSGVR